MYVVAVLHRTSLGVAGLDAQVRFDIGAGALASFAVLQLLVYAALQVPVGEPDVVAVAVDRPLPEVMAEVVAAFS